ncbi:MAG: outer membrane protein [Acidobacteriota bacterium]
MRTRNLVSGVVILALSVCGATLRAQTSVALSAYGAFSGTTTANGVQESPANSAGGMFELRHVGNPILGFEGTYSFNRANQEYTGPGPCPVGIVSACPPTTTQTIKADAHEITADWVPSVGLANFRAFGVLGVGMLLNVPSGGQSNTQTSTKAVYVYGAGLDWGLLPHLGLRLQYRGNLYKSPDVTQLFTSVNKFTHTAEPMIGVYFNL